MPMPAELWRAIQLLQDVAGVDDFARTLPLGRGGRQQS